MATSLDLKKDLNNTNLKSGDYGIVWAVYPYYARENNEALEFDYEATFENREAGIDDSMFDEEDVEKVLRIEDAFFSESMKKLWLYINQNKKAQID